jgi:hypothetical protein
MALYMMGKVPYLRWGRISHWLGRHAKAMSSTFCTEPDHRLSFVPTAREGMTVIEEVPPLRVLVGRCLERFLLGVHQKLD